MFVGDFGTLEGFGGCTVQRRVSLNNLLTQCLADKQEVFSGVCVQ